MPQENAVSVAINEEGKLTALVDIHGPMESVMDKFDQTNAARHRKWKICRVPIKVKDFFYVLPAIEATGVRIKFV